MDVDISVYGPTGPILPIIIHLLYDTCEVCLSSVTSSNQHVITSLEILGDLCLRLGVVIKLVEQRTIKDFWILNYGKIMVITMHCINGYMALYYIQ